VLSGQETKSECSERRGMKPGSHERVPTVSEVVREAAAICDPERSATAVTALFECFEDDDRPTTAVEDLRGELLKTVGGIDPEADEPAAAAAAAAAVWLATNPGQSGNGEHVLREGIRLVYGGQPPEHLSRWLEGRGVEV
jgi:hypothetical protein